MEIKSVHFKDAAADALKDQDLRQAMEFAKHGFIGKRTAAVADLPEWDRIREDARIMKNHVLENLDHYLLAYEAAVINNGGQVHWAQTSTDAASIVVDLCQQVQAKTVAKGKTMVGEEADINGALEAVGITPIETDLGEYILQLGKEPPSHIIAPAIHKTKEQVTELFHEHHQQYGLTEKLIDRAALVNEARTVLRDKFIAADVGITGANFLIAETGQHILVTNEGNGDLSSVLPKTQIVIVGIEKVIPNLNDAAALLRMLARSATGQDFSNYTSLMSGPKRADDTDGPENFHVVLVDNKRTDMLAGELREMLRCFKCGACMNHCPVYGAVGGHAYGWVYPGPMGSVVTPVMVGLENAPDLPHACTLNGRCADVCPMSIPLPSLLRKHRQATFERQLISPGSRFGISAWASLAKRPRLYRLISKTANKVLHGLGRGRGRFAKMPLAGGWTQSRDLPAPQSASTFMSLYKQSRKADEQTNQQPKGKP